MAAEPGADVDETAYAALAAAVDDARWAFGTGFADPLAGVPTDVPDGVDGDALAAYCVMLADDALVFSHRLQEWITRLPELEDEAAVANIGLDLLGQARRLLTRAGQVDGSGRTEDEFAFGRDPVAWRCVRLTELPIDDFAALVLRVLVVTTWRAAVMSRLRSSADPVLAAIAEQSVKELDYHLEWAAGWVIRLGDGTEESHRRMQTAIEETWRFVPEIFDDHPVERALPGVAVPSSAVRAGVDSAIDTVLAEATLARPAALDDGSEHRAGLLAGRTGRDGGHTEFLSRMLAEMQTVARADPGARW